MEANKRRSVAPFYAVAVLWLAYALLFPLYEPLHYGLLGMASAAVFVVVSLLCRGGARSEAKASAAAEEPKKEEAPSTGRQHRRSRDLRRHRAAGAGVCQDL